jgi:multicomponent Na+:H+ antiporter subunit E
MTTRSPSSWPAAFPSLALAAVARLLFFLLVWGILTEGNVHGWGVPALAIGAATLASLALRGPDSRWSLRGLLRFIPFFLTQSVRGGIDVARRAFHPSLPINPGVEEYRSRLPTTPQRATLAAVIGLFPGTLSVRLEGDRLTIHSLSREHPVSDSVREVEIRLANLFRVELAAEGE